MLVVCASLSGAPGVSSMAVGMAARWPQQPALLLEADPSGGVLAARFGLAQQPGLASLAAQMRHGDAGDMAAHAQRLPLGCDVVTGPGSAETAAGAIAILAAHADTALRALAPVVVADAGRLYLGSPATPLLAAADAVLLVTTPSIEDIDHLDARMPTLRDTARWGRLGVVLTGKGPFGRDEVAERLGVPVVGDLPRDRWGAAALAGRMTGRGWARTRLARATHELADWLTAEFGADLSTGLSIDLSTDVSEVAA